MPAISEELLAKFLRGLCTEEEAAQVEAYFQQHPEDDFLLDEYDATDAVTPLPEGEEEEMLQMIRLETGIGATSPDVRLGADDVRRRGMRITLYRIMVAAACVLVVVAGWGLLLRKTSANVAPATATPQLAVWIGKFNGGNKKISIQLPDSSRATLSPGAIIRYRQDFGHYEKREVKLEGEVAFSVVKDRQSPFIVYSEGVSTTVLGTTFEVKAEKGGDQIRVRLLEGKVMVGLDSLLKDSVRHYLLSPGEEFIYGKGSRSIVIREFNGHGSGYATNRVRRLSSRPDSLSNWYMFNNQALADVFDQLSVLYNVDIQYSKEDLYNCYFIGKLEKKDSPGEIIKDIALLNHLTVIMKDGHYIIRKRKP